ncbi:MAG: GWxTD domain-containing protein [Ignavibacteria bacterium]|nr:GWxTD domain-containing protein [Ignavibacteria bacterium]
MTMNTHRFLLFATLALLYSGAEAQMRRTVAPFESVRSQSFFFDAITYAADDSQQSHIDFYIQVPHQQFRFVKEGDQFVARSEIAITYRREPDGESKEVVWSEVFAVLEFDQTTSPKYYRLMRRGVDVLPGNYRIEVKFQDLESRKTSTITRTLHVVDFSRDSVGVSDIMIVSRLSNDGVRWNIVPNISANIAEHSEGFFLYFEIYNRTTLDSVTLITTILNAKQEVVYTAKQEELLKGSRTQSFVRVVDFLPDPGEYRVIIEAQPRDSAIGATVSTTSRSFVMRPSDLPITIQDIDKAVEQLMYIARESEMQHMRNAREPEEKRSRLLEFWNKRDPDPQTPRNELMEEYYSRVEYANKNFSHYVEGWRTDMGMVYIRFGPPENVDRHPFTTNTRPYEIWYYYQLNREFIFVDETGFGDYRLRYPTTDLWGRIR